jgi:hypothetical protein
MSTATGAANRLVIRLRLEDRERRGVAEGDVDAGQCPNSNATRGERRIGKLHAGRTAGHPQEESQFRSRCGPRICQALTAGEKSPGSI